MRLTGPEASGPVSSPRKKSAPKTPDPSALEGISVDQKPSGITSADVEKWNEFEKEKQTEQYIAEAETELKKLAGKTRSKKTGAFDALTNTVAAETEKAKRRNQLKKIEKAVSSELTPDTIKITPADIARHADITEEFTPAEPSTTTAPSMEAVSKTQPPRIEPVPPVLPKLEPAPVEKNPAPAIGGMPAADRWYPPTQTQKISAPKPKSRGGWWKRGLAFLFGGAAVLGSTSQAGTDKQVTKEDLTPPPIASSTHVKNIQPAAPTAEGSAGVEFRVNPEGPWQKVEVSKPQMQDYAYGGTKATFTWNVLPKQLSDKFKNLSFQQKERELAIHKKALELIQKEKGVEIVKSGNLDVVQKGETVYLSKANPYIEEYVERVRAEGLV